MDDGPFERVQALDVRPRPATEQAEAGEKDIRGVVKLRCLFILRLPLLDALPIRLDTDSKYLSSGLNFICTTESVCAFRKG